jgi:hypothetical protein
VRRDPTAKLVRYLACAGHVAVLLMPIQAVGQQPNFQIKADDACERIPLPVKRLLTSIASCRLINAADLPQEHHCTIICNVTIASDSLKGRLGLSEDNLLRLHS